MPTPLARRSLSRTAFFLTLFCLLLLGFSLPRAQAQTTGQVRYFPRTGYESRMTGGLFQNSQNNSTWTTLYTVSIKPSDVSPVAGLTTAPTTFRALHYLAPSGSYGSVVKAQMPYKEKLEGTIADHMVADYRTRALARRIHTDQIASIQFRDLLNGPQPISMPTSDPNQVPVHPYFEPTVTDRRLIARFLRALRHAYKPAGFMTAEATPSLEITFRKSGRFRRDPLDIHFAYLGPEFQSVLNQVPAYLAAQLHRKMSALDGQVREVDFATLKVTDSRKIAQITRALKQVKPGALGVYGSAYDTFGLRLRLRRGGSQEVVFVLEHSLVSRLGSAMLPQPLWNYYKLVSRAKAAQRLNTDKTFPPEAERQFRATCRLLT